MSEYDRFSIRICMILERLFLGETLSINELANEFNVSKKTISRDFNERLANLLRIEIEMVKKGQYKLSENSMSLLRNNRYRGILEFSKVIDIDKLFPKQVFDSKFISVLFSNKNHSSCIIHIDSFDEQPNMYGPFLTIIQATINKTLITIKTNNEVFDHFAPYKLIKFKSHWYLVGIYEKKFHVITYDVIKEVLVISVLFDVDVYKLQKIEEENFIQSFPHFNYTIGGISSRKKII